MAAECAGYAPGQEHPLALLWTGWGRFSPGHTRKPSPSLANMIIPIDIKREDLPSPGTCSEHLFSSPWWAEDQIAGHGVSCDGSPNGLGGWTPTMTRNRRTRTTTVFFYFDRWSSQTWRNNQCKGGLTPSWNTLKIPSCAASRPQQANAPPYGSYQNTGTWPPDRPIAESVAINVFLDK